MTRILSILFAAFLLAAPVLGSPAEAYAAALRNARNRPVAIRIFDRYLWLDETDEAAKKDTLIAVEFQLNQLSRRFTFLRFEKVANNLLRYNLLEAGHDPKVWEKQLAFEKFFHQEIEIDQIVDQHFGFTRNGVWTTTRIEKVKKRVKVQAQALWLDPLVASELVRLTQTQVPVVNARWWLVNTGRQFGLNGKENGFGYYDWFGIKKRDDYFKVIKLNEKDSLEFGRVTRAIVVNSGVSEQNRQIERLQALGGGHWYTLDTDDSTGHGNAIRNIGRGDFKHKAERHYGVLPNGLFIFLLCDNQGKLQAVAPPFIGPDDSPLAGKAWQLHACLGCVRCHVEGLRPIDDWARKNLRKPLQLQSPDYQKIIDAEQQYFSNLNRQLEVDRKVYADALFDLNGKKPIEMARLFAKVYDTYITPWDADQIARLVGMETKVMIKKLQGYALVKGGIDLVIAPLLSDPKAAIRPEHVEEAWSTLLEALGYSR